MTARDALGQLCPRCGEWKPLDQFYESASLPGNWCRACKAEHYRTNRDVRIAYATARHDRQQDLIRDIKLASGCVDCGYSALADALEFDHRPGHVKLFNISSRIQASWDRILVEMDKCDVRCANCHRAKTAERRSEAIKAIQLSLFGIEATDPQGTLFL